MVLPTVLSDQPEDHPDIENEEMEPELAEDVDTEELMRSMASKLTPSARFRWRRSRWLRHCPVSLADGNIVPGKAEYAVSYAISRLFVTYLGLCFTGLFFVLSTFWARSPSVYRNLLELLEVSKPAVSKLRIQILKSFHYTMITLYPTCSFKYFCLLQLFPSTLMVQLEQLVRYVCLFICV